MPEESFPLGQILDDNDDLMKGWVRMHPLAVDSESALKEEAFDLVVDAVGEWFRMHNNELPEGWRAGLRRYITYRLKEKMIDVWTHKINEDMLELSRSRTLGVPVVVEEVEESVEYPVEEAVPRAIP